MLPQTIRPSRWYYLVSLMIISIGVVLFFIITIKGMSSVPGKLIQMEAPGTAEMTFKETGEYTIFYEHQSELGGRIYNTGESLSGLWLNVTSRETGEPLILNQPAVNTTYTVGGRSGVSVLQFKIERPGVYEVSAAYRGNGGLQQEVVLAVGHGVAGTITATVIGALVSMFGSILIALTVAVVTFVRRRSARKAMRWGGYPAYPPAFARH